MSALLTSWCFHACALPTWHVCTPRLQVCPDLCHIGELRPLCRVPLASSLLLHCGMRSFSWCFLSQRDYLRISYFMCNFLLRDLRPHSDVVPCICNLADGQFLPHVVHVVQTLVTANVCLGGFEHLPSEGESHFYHAVCLFL